VSEWLDLAVQAARDAGTAILSVYRQKLDIETKGDGSPLTIADQSAHKAIVARLAASEIAVVSEEGDDLHMGVRRYWLVDPLDGTKDFLAGNDEFTVNIAFVVDQAPVMGVVYAPALDELYAGEFGVGAWKEKAGIRSRCSAVEKSLHCRMAASRFHDHPDVDLFAAANRIDVRVAVGSALKYGQLASAEVDVFPRLVGSSEWDTAAGQAVLEAAGGQVLDWHTGKPLRYGKPRRRNPRLLALRAPYALTDFELKTYEPELL
jgi:3'(2'), 5'-bisphosphate nucleotidase